MVKQKSDQSTASRLNRFQKALVVALILQNTATVLVGRYTRTPKASNENLYDLNQFLLVGECCKLVFSLLLEWWVSDFNLVASLKENILKTPFEALKMAVPSATYLVSNALLYVALSNLTVPVYQVVYQGKLVITAFVSVLMLKRQYSTQQWFCLFFISCGVGIIATDGMAGSGGTKADIHVVLGLLSLTVSCLLSSFASVYFEKVVKQKTCTEKETSLWMRNIQLSFFSIIFAFCLCVVSTDSGKPPMHGFDSWVYLQVTLFGVGGLLVASVIKHADNVMKGMATAMSIILATIFSVYIFGTVLNAHFLFGSAMVLPSVYLYSNPCHLQSDKKTCALSLGPITSFRLVTFCVMAVSIIRIFSPSRSILCSLGDQSVLLQSDGAEVNVGKRLGMHSLRNDLPAEERPAGMTDIEWAVNKEFSEVEDATLLAEWEKSRPEEERNILTFVTSISDGYDAGPNEIANSSLASHPKVRFIFLSDDMDYVVSHPWEQHKNDYPSRDRRVDFGYRNSLTRLLKHVNDTENPRQHHYANMWTKYFCHLFWRIPEVRKSRYVAYVGAQMNLLKIPYEFYDRFINEMSKGNHRLHMYDPHKTLYKEAEVASRQKRYAMDDVRTQTRWYESNYEIPANDSSSFKLFWLAISVYDNYHAPTRQVLFDTWVECQLWSLEDQISYPVALANSGEYWKTTSMVRIPDQMKDWLGLSPTDRPRFPHNTIHYGKRF